MKRMEMNLGEMIPREMNLRKRLNPGSHLSCSHVELETGNEFILLVREPRSSRSRARLARLGPKTPRFNLHSKLK